MKSITHIRVSIDEHGRRSFEEIGELSDLALRPMTPHEIVGLISPGVEMATKKALSLDDKQRKKQLKKARRVVRDSRNVADVYHALSTLVGVAGTMLFDNPIYNSTPVGITSIRSKKKAG